jgi:hypothetical protein
MNFPHGELDLENILLDDNEEIVIFDNDFLKEQSLT